MREVGTIASSGSTVITANYGRFRRRMTMGIIALILLIVGGVVGVGRLLDDSAEAPDDVVAVPEADDATDEQEHEADDAHGETATEAPGLRCDDRRTTRRDGAHPPERRPADCCGSPWVTLRPCSST